MDHFWNEREIVQYLQLGVPVLCEISCTQFNFPHILLYIIFNSRIFTCTSTINNLGLLREWHCAISSPCLFFHIHNFIYIIKLYKNNLQSKQSICVYLIHKQSKSWFNPNRILLFIYFYFKWKMRTCERKGFI